MTRILLQGAALALFQTVGTLRPRVSGQPMLTRDSLLNLANGVLLFVLVAPLAAWVAARSELGLVQLDLDAGWSQFLVAFLLLDLSRYWVHRADHRIPWLWTFHRVHHSAETLDATTGLRMHAVDFVQLSAIPILLFGVGLDVQGFEGWVIPAAIGMGVVMDAFQHANIHVGVGGVGFRLWNSVLNNPHFHCWHHTRDGHLCDGNYGNCLTIWDRLFGSEVTQPAPPEEYGIGGDQRLTNDLLSWQLLR